MRKYLSTIVVFDVLLPALLLGLPGCILLWALVSFQQFAETKSAEFSAHQDRVRFVEALNRELQPVQAKVPLLNTLLSNKDIESRVDHGILVALEKFSEFEDDYAGGFADDEAGSGEPTLPSWSELGIPAENPYRDVGRNDPCPCGSGKKFKKCCLPQ